MFHEFDHRRVLWGEGLMSALMVMFQFVGVAEMHRPELLFDLLDPARDIVFSTGEFHRVFDEFVD